MVAADTRTAALKQAARGATNWQLGKAKAGVGRCAFLAKVATMSVDTLIIDDSESFAALLRAKLEHMGCTVVGISSSSKEGLQDFRDLRPRLVTLDLSMPDTADFAAVDLFATIRSEIPETAVVVISAQPRYANASQFLAQGAIAYMEKTFMNFAQLRARLEQTFPELKEGGKSEIPD
jgi:DNA-binding NtrC family response regulator